MARERWMLAAMLVVGGAVWATRKPEPHVPDPSPPRPELPAIVLASADAQVALPIPIDLRGPRMWFNVALYFPEVPVKPVSDLVSTKAFTVVAEMPAEPGGAVMQIKQLPREKMAPPSPKTLEQPGHHLTDAEKVSMQGVKGGARLTFDAPAAEGVKHLRAAMRVVSDLAAATSAFIVDVDTRQAYSRVEWERLAKKLTGTVPEVELHITIHLYRDGELYRLVTLGMNKFALPEIVVEQVSKSAATPMGSLIDLVCQTLIEKGRLDAPGQLAVSIDDIKGKELQGRLLASLQPGATKRAVVQLVTAQAKAGDAENSVIALSFPGPAAALQRRQDAFLAALFGATDVSAVEDHGDPALIAASARAKKTLLTKHKPRWTTTPPSLESLIVKAPFKTKGGSVEWMWVEVVTWRGTKLAGVLQNDPIDVPGLAAGARVEVEESAVFDYMIKKADGSTEGGETVDILRKKQKK